MFSLYCRRSRACLGGGREPVGGGKIGSFLIFFIGPKFYGRAQ